MNAGHNMTSVVLLNGGRSVRILSLVLLDCEWMSHLIF